MAESAVVVEVVPMVRNIWTAVVGLSGAFGLGMCFATLGSIAVKMMPRLKMDQAKFGSLISVFMFSCLIASLAVGTGMDILGYKTVATAGFILAGISIIIIANTKSIGVTMVAAVSLGVGAMACNTTGNVLGMTVMGDIMKDSPSAASNLVNVCFGLGLFLTPFLVSFLFQKVSYEKAVSALGIVVLIPAGFTLMAEYPDAAGFKLSAAVALLKEPATIVAALILFCYIALESSFCNWLAPFGKEVIAKEKPDMEEGKVDASAARLLSAFAIAMMAGRFLTAVSGITSVGSWLIVASAVLAVVLIFVMMGANKGSAAFALAAVAGFVFAPAFPTTLGVTSGKFGGMTGSLFGIIFAVGLAGAVIVPKAMGNMAKGASIQKALKLLLPAAVLLAILAVAFNFVKGPADREAEAIAAAAAVTEVVAEDTTATVPTPALVPEPAPVNE